MPDDFDWAQFNDANQEGGGGFVTFKEIGDHVIGEITALRVGRDVNGNPCPELLILTDNGTVQTLTAAQKVLQRLLGEIRPTTGDRISVMYVGEGKARPGFNAPKLFEVKIMADEAGDELV